MTTVYHQSARLSPTQIGIIGAGMEVVHYTLARISLIVLFCIYSEVSAETYPEIVIDGNTGAVLHQQRVFQSWYPASLTKMMTLYLTFASLASGELKLNDKLNASAYATSQPPSRLGLVQGETLSVYDAITALATVSANDVAVVIAERLAGNEHDFAVKMTLQAQRLGMTGTRFKNASGLPNSAQVTNAHDMVILGYRLLQDFPQHFDFFSVRTFTYKRKKRSNTNRLLADYAGSDGIKTGFTCGSGYNLVASVHRGTERLIGVVLGGGSGSERNSRMRNLLNLGFRKLKSAGRGVNVDSLTNLFETKIAAAPIRLSTSKCGQAASNWIYTEGNLPGWGVLLGVFVDKKAATAKLQKFARELRKIAPSGRPALVMRKFYRGSSWKILLVDLEKLQAGKICKYLRKSARPCVALSPQAMNSRGFSKR